MTSFTVSAYVGSCGSFYEKRMGVGFELLLQSSVDGESWIENGDQPNVVKY